MQLTTLPSSEGEKPMIEQHNDALNNNLNELNKNLNELNNNHLYDFAMEFSLQTN